MISIVLASLLFCFSDMNTTNLPAIPLLERLGWVLQPKTQGADEKQVLPNTNTPSSGKLPPPRLGSAAPPHHSPRPSTLLRRPTRPSGWAPSLQSSHHSDTPSSCSGHLTPSLLKPPFRGHWLPLWRQAPPPHPQPHYCPFTQRRRRLSLCFKYLLFITKISRSQIWHFFLSPL